MQEPPTPRIPAWWLPGLLLCACSGEIGSQLGSTPRDGDPDHPWLPGADPAAAPGAGPGGSPSGAAGAATSGSAPGTEGTPNTDAAPSAEACRAPAIGPSPLRRLTHDEYDNSVRDLLGDTTRPARAFAADTQVGLFDNTAATQTVSVLLADQYLSAAQTLAETADLPALLGCDPAGPDAAGCVRGFVERFGRHAYRRPPTSAELDALLALFESQRTAADAATGVRGVIAAVLASPHFLFRPESGAGASVVPGANTLSPYERAARLASLLWASLPDETLLDAAAAGQLQTPADVEAQARRMLDDPKARPALAAFYAQWFGLDLLQSATKDPEAYPSFDEALRASMMEETRRFIEHVLWEDDARLSTLLSAPYSILDARLAVHYGIDGPGAAAGFARTPLDTDQRSGVLTHASVLSAFASPSESSPVKRGKWVRVRILCQDLPDPPAEVPELPAPREGVSTRERFAMHTDNPACSGCHNLIDGLGFGLEHYDGIGAFRALDHGVAVDASGQINETVDIDGSYEGGPELARLLAGSTQVRDCAPTQWLRYALGRRETPDDACSLSVLEEAFAASGGDLRELMVALTQTDAFLNYRRPGG